MTAARRRSLTARISGPMAILRRNLDLFLDRIQFLRRQFLLTKKRQDQLARRPCKELCQQLMNGLSSGCVSVNPGHENKGPSLFTGRKVAFHLEYRHESENGGVGILSVEGFNHVRNRR